MRNRRIAKRPLAILLGIVASYFAMVGVASTELGLRIICFMDYEAFLEENHSIFLLGVLGTLWFFLALLATAFIGLIGYILFETIYPKVKE